MRVVVYQFIGPWGGGLLFVPPGRGAPADMSEWTCHGEYELPDALLEKIRATSAELPGLPTTVPENVIAAVFFDYR